MAAASPKFNRTYFLTVLLQSGELITIQPPITLEIDIVRKSRSALSEGTFRIYNLSANHRNLLRFNMSNTGTYQQVILRGGYGFDLPVIFTGNIMRGYSVREGVNFITTIECRDGGFAANNSAISETIGANNTRLAYLRLLMKAASGANGHLSPGAISKSLTVATDGSPQTIPRGTAINDPSALNLLMRDTNGQTFVDLGLIHCLNTNDYINSTQAIVVNSSSGLLGTPLLEETSVHFDMIFEPRLKSGYAVQLDSITDNNYNGPYKINGVKHRGIFSPTVCGELITTGEFYYSKQLIGVNLPTL